VVLWPRSHCLCGPVMGCTAQSGSTTSGVSRNAPYSGSPPVGRFLCSGRPRLWAPRPGWPPASRPGHYSRSTAGYIRGTDGYVKRCGPGGCPCHFCTVRPGDAPGVPSGPPSGGAPPAMQTSKRALRFGDGPSGVRRLLTKPTKALAIHRRFGLASRPVPRDPPRGVPQT